jgi:hypothetical protein
MWLLRLLQGYIDAKGLSNVVCGNFHGMECGLSKLKGANMKRKSIIEGLSILVALILVILASGCATTRMYTGEALPKEKIAVIRGSNNQRFLRTIVFTVTIVSVNEERLKNPAKGRSQRIEIIPRVHEILVDMERTQCHGGGFLWPSCNNFFLKQQRLELNVQAGHEYKIQLENWWTPDGFIIAVDTNTAEVILRNPLGAIFL